jgi:hypothetical protein
MLAENNGEYRVKRAVRRRRRSFVAHLPGHPTFDTIDEARARAEDHADLFPVGVTAVEIVDLADKPDGTSA